jgi:hypothetical protein
MFWEADWAWAALRYCEGGTFENKISAAFFVSQMLVFAHDEVRDRLGNGGGFQGVCVALGGFEAEELESVAIAILGMFDLNFALYAGLFMENVPFELLDSVIEAAEGSAIAVEALELVRTRVLASLA